MLRDAFYSALCAVNPLLSSSDIPSSRDQATIKSAQLVTAFQFEKGSSQSLSNNLVHIQTLMLLAIKASQANPSGGSSQSMWLGSAVGLAYTLKLHQLRPSIYMAAEDQDDERLARKIWWALVVMDRWHASSTSSPVLIPDSSVVVSPDDQDLLGESLYQVAREFASLVYELS